MVIQIKEKHLNDSNSTPLHIAAKNDSVRMGELLISKGADINAKDIIHQYMNLSFLIMEKQINERNFNRNKKTPLYFVAMKDSIKMGELLISKGADINAKDIIH